MITIYKYPAPVSADRLTITLPEGAEILTVQVQNGEPHVWARVDNSRPPVARLFRWYGTGHASRLDAKYIGTIQLHDGALVFHLFEL